MSEFCEARLARPSSSTSASDHKAALWQRVSLKEVSDGFPITCSDVPQQMFTDPFVEEWLVIPVTRGNSG